MKIYTAEDGTRIHLDTKDTDMLIIRFFKADNSDGKPFSEIRLRGSESDAVIKMVKGLR